MRGMIKWKPFNTLLKTSDIEEISKSKTKKEKPVLMIDRINYINETLNYAINNNSNLCIKYWAHETLKEITGTLKKINTIEKYILINETRIYFKNLINITIL